MSETKKLPPAMDNEPKPYEGDEPFIFVSYSHKNKREAHQMIDRLQRDGYRVWWDNGIHGASTWTDKLAQKISTCDFFIPLYTKEWSESKFCSRELTYADSKNRKICLISLTKFPLPEKVDFVTSETQRINKYEYIDENAFYRELYKSDGIAKCRTVTKVVKVKIPEHSDDNKKINEAQKKFKYIKVIIAGIVVIASGIIFCLAKNDEIIDWLDGVNKRLFNEYVENYSISSVTGKTGLYTGYINRKGLPDDDFATLTLSDGSVCAGPWKDGEPVGPFYVSLPIDNEYCVYMGGISSSSYRPEDDIALLWAENSDFLYEIEDVWWCENLSFERDYDEKQKGSDEHYSYTGIYAGYFITGAEDESDEDSIYNQGRLKTTIPFEWNTGYIYNFLNGQGILTSDNGDVWEGTFINGFLNGHGTYAIASSGDTYEGKWVDGKKNGNFTVTHADGSVEKLYYQNGDLIG